MCRVILPGFPESASNVCNESIPYLVRMCVHSFVLTETCAPNSTGLIHRLQSSHVPLLNHTSRHTRVFTPPPAINQGTTSAPIRSYQTLHEAEEDPFFLS